MVAWYIYPYYIYLQDWLILFGPMLVNVPYMDHPRFFFWIDIFEKNKHRSVSMTILNNHCKARTIMMDELDDFPFAVELILNVLCHKFRKIGPPSMDEFLVDDQRLTMNWSKEHWLKMKFVISR